MKDLKELKSVLEQMVNTVSAKQSKESDGKKRSGKTCNWTILLLKISKPKTNEKEEAEKTVYLSRSIKLEPKNALFDLIKYIGEKHTKDKGQLAAYTDVRAYDGTTVGNVVYSIAAGDPRIKDEYDEFSSSLTDPDVEGDAFKYTSAYIINGSIQDEKGTKTIMMISMQNPFVNMKQKYASTRKPGVFAQYDKPLLSLKSTIDVLIIDNEIYFLTLNGEKLFNMERAYNKKRNEAVEVIEKAGIVSDLESFKLVAGKGLNPRRFLKFDENKLNALKKIKTRKKMADKFGLILDDHNLFDTSDKEVAEKLVKLLCDRGMMDPIMKTAVEVNGAKKWS